jgi:hypothetical protein
MVKDYAKRKSSFRVKSAKSGRNRKIILLLIVLVITAFFINRLVHRLMYSKKTVINIETGINAKKVAEQTDFDAGSKVQFDFYNILPKEKVSINLASSSTETEPKYYLEIVSVANRQDAIHLKSDLDLLGFDAFITPSKQGASVINIGPYYYLDMAKTDQSKLRSKNINSILKKT